jgi:hypothetical protein
LAVRDHVLINNDKSGVKSAGHCRRFICVPRKAERQRVVPPTQVIDKLVVGCDHQHVRCLSGLPPLIGTILARSRAETLLLSNLTPEAGSDPKAPCGTNLIYNAFPARIPDRTRPVEVFPTAQRRVVACERLSSQRVRDCLRGNKSGKIVLLDAIVTTGSTRCCQSALLDPLEDSIRVDGAKPCGVAGAEPFASH